MKANRPQHAAWENHAKLLQERIALVEKHFADLCTTFGAYSRKIAGIQEKNDALTKTIFSYSEAENVNRCMKTCLLEFSKTLENVGEYRDIQVHRMETNVSEFSQYEKLCKHAKEEIKNTLASRDREIARRKQLDRLRERNPRNRPQITAAQVELSKASMEVANNMKWLEEQMDHFEKKKLQDIRSFLLSYITAELSFHVKAVELFTKGYKDIADMNIDMDLEEFQSYIHDTESSTRLETVKRTTLRQSIANLFSTPATTTRTGQNTIPVTTKDAGPKTSQENSEFIRDLEDELSVPSDASETSGNHRHSSQYNEY